MTSKLEQALSLAEKGFYIFPCQVHGKPPLIKKWQECSTKTPDTIRKWWGKKWLEANIGIDCGKSGIYVIDIDCKNGKPGNENFKKLDRENGFPLTLVSHTPSGGRHLIYAATGLRNTTNALAKGIDTRGEGGYIVAPGSVIDGKEYQWDDSKITIAPLPKWIIDRLSAYKTPSLKKDKRILSEDHPHDIEWAINFLQNDAEEAIEGDGGDSRTVQIAMYLKDHGIGVETAIQMMSEYYNPRCSPSWDEPDLEKKVRSAYKSALNPQGIKSAHVEFSDLENTPLRFETVSADDFASGPEPEWIVKEVLRKGGIAMVFGKSGAAKTFFILDVLASIALDRYWCGRKVKQGRVVYIAAEGASGVRNRLKAYKNHYKISFGNNFVVINDTPNLLHSNDVTVLAESINRSGGASVIVIDTLAQTTPGADENTSKDMGKALSACKALNKATGALIILVHHRGKDESRGARGWSGMKGAMDTEIEVKEEIQGRYAKITKQKDGEAGDIFAFKLVPVEIGFSSEGDAITSCIVQYLETNSEIIKIKPQGIWQRSVYKAIQTLTSSDQTHHTVEQVIDEAIRDMPHDPGTTQENPKRDRRRESALRALKEISQELVRVKDNMVCLSQYHKAPQIDFCGNVAKSSIPPQLPHDSIGVWPCGIDAVENRELDNFL